MSGVKPALFCSQPTEIVYKNRANQNTIRGIAWKKRGGGGTEAVTQTSRNHYRKTAWPFWLQSWAKNHLGAPSPFGGDIEKKRFLLTLNLFTQFLRPGRGRAGWGTPIFRGGQLWPAGALQNTFNRGNPFKLPGGGPIPDSLVAPVPGAFSGCVSGGNKWPINIRPQPPPAHGDGLLQTFSIPHLLFFNKNRHVQKATR